MLSHRFRHCLAHFLLFPLAAIHIYIYVRHSHIRDVYLSVCFIYVCTRGVDTSSEGWSIDVLLTTVWVLFTSVIIVSVRNGFTRMCMRFFFFFFSLNLKRLTNMCIAKKMRERERAKRSQAIWSWFFSLWSQITDCPDDRKAEESTICADRIWKLK